MTIPETKQTDTANLHVFKNAGSHPAPPLEKKTVASEKSKELTSEGKPARSTGSEPVKIIQEKGAFSWSGGEQSFRQTFGSTDTDFAQQLFLQLRRASPPALPGRDTTDECNSSLAALGGIAPRDPLEGMLAVQMVAVHNYAMDALERANRPGQPEDIRDAGVNRAVKLLKTFSMQVESLSNYRNNATQNMVVEQVHVHKGAQAIVGPVAPRAANTQELK